MLAVATFAAVRSSNRSAAIAQEALRVGMRPLLVPSRFDDAKQKVFFGDGYVAPVEGGRAWVAVEDQARGGEPQPGTLMGDGSECIYLAISLRNAGAGIAVLRRWSIDTRVGPGTLPPGAPDVGAFRRHTRDLYIPPGDIGFWQGAIRMADDDRRDDLLTAIKNSQPVAVDIHYSDHEGGQQAVSRFVLRPLVHEADGQEQQFWLPSVVRHWNLDRPDPRTPDRDELVQEAPGGIS